METKITLFDSREEPIETAHCDSPAPLGDGFEDETPASRRGWSLGTVHDALFASAMTRQLERHGSAWLQHRMALNKAQAVTKAGTSVSRSLVEQVLLDYRRVQRDSSDEANAPHDGGTASESAIQRLVRALSDEPVAMSRASLGQLYQPRESEYEDFARFLDSADRVAVVLGGFGTGKTTYVLEKILNPTGLLRYQDTQGLEHRSCNGIRIDVSGLPAVEPQEVLSKTIAEEISSRFIAHFSALLASNNTHLGLRFDRDLRTGGQATAAEACTSDPESQRYAAAAVLLTAPRQRLTRPVRELLASVHRLQLSEKVASIARQLRLHGFSSLNDVLAYASKGAPDSSFWFDVYSRWFEHEVPLLFIDGLEGMPSTRSQTAALQAISALAGSMTGRSASHRSRWKVVIALRDDVLERTGMPEGLRPFTSIILTEYSASRGLLKSRSFNPLTHDCMWKIVTRRLKWLLATCSDEGDEELCQLTIRLAGVIDELWLRSPRREGHFHALNLVSLANESIRTALDLVFRSGITSLCRERSIRVGSGAARQRALTPSSLDTVFGGDNAEVLQDFVVRDRRGISRAEPLCCTYRTILAYLNSHATKRQRLTTEDCFSDLSMYGALSRREFREGVWTLCRPGEDKWRFVTLEQPKRFERPDDLDPQGSIRINERGVMLYRVQQTVEYWTRVLSMEGNERFPETVFELRPRGAARLFGSLAKLVVATSKAHRLNWEKMMVRAPGRRKFTNVPYFKVLSENLFRGEPLFIERVVASHLETLLVYVRICGEELGLLEDERTRATFECVQRNVDVTNAWWGNARELDIALRTSAADLADRDFEAEYLMLVLEALFAYRPAMDEVGYMKSYEARPAS